MTFMSLGGRLRRGTYGPWSLMAGVAVVRLVYSWPIDGPRVTPDELAIFGMGRWFAGDDWNMFTASTWRPGLSVLMAPIHILFDDSAHVYRAGVALNCLIGAGAAAVLLLVVRQLTALSERASWLVVLALSVTPAALSSSALIWGEPLVQLCYFASLLLLYEVSADRSAMRHGMFAIAIAGFGFLSHSRLLPLLVVVGVYVAGWAMVRRRAAAAAVATGLTGCCYLIVELVSEQFYRGTYESTASTNTVSATLARLGNPLRLVESALSQSWYLLVCYALLVAFGLLALCQSAANGGSPQRWFAATTLGLSATLFGVSALFMSNRFRSDQVIYGRYNDAIIAPIVAAGVAWLLVDAKAMQRAAFVQRVAISAVLALALGLFVAQRHGEILAQQQPFVEMVPGLGPVLALDTQFRPLLFSGIAITLGLAFAFLARTSGPKVVGGVGAGVLVVSALLSFSDVRSSGAANFDSAGLLEQRELLQDLESVGFAFSPGTGDPQRVLARQMDAAFQIQWELRDIALVRDNGIGDGIGPYVFADSDDFFLLASKSEQLWRDQVTGISLWRENEQLTGADIVAAARECTEAAPVDEPGDDELLACVRDQLDSAG